MEYTRIYQNESDSGPRSGPMFGASHENIMFLTAPFGFLALGANDIQNLIQPLHLSALSLSSQIILKNHFSFTRDH